MCVADTRLIYIKYTHIHTHTHTHLHIHTNQNTHARAPPIHKRAHAHAHLHTRTHTHIYKYTHTHTYTHSHPRIHPYTNQTRIHPPTHPHTPTHTHNICTCTTAARSALRGRRRESASYPELRINAERHRGADPSADSLVPASPSPDMVLFVPARLIRAKGWATF